MNMDKIIWKDVDNYEGVYEISNTAVIRRKDNHQIKKQHVDNLGYYAVSLWKDGAGQTVRVHRILAKAFIPNPNNYPCINHKDEDMSNNSLENLEWCTKKYNNCYGTKIQRQNKKKNRAILQYSLSGDLLKEYESESIAASVCGISQARISNSALNGGIPYKGYIWRFKEERERKYKKMKKVGKYTSNGELVKVYDSIVLAGLDSGISGYTISNCVCGYIKTAGGFYWKYIN